MTQFFSVHPANPQPRLIRQAADLVREGNVIVYPTDSCYALGCRLDDRTAVDRIRAIRALDAKHHFTLVCRDLSEVARYARVDNQQFRLLKSATPGSYTFILEATREVPRRLQHPKRKTIGLRVPDHPVAQALLAALDEAILSTSLVLPGDELPLNDAGEIRERLEGLVDLIIDSGACGLQVTTVVDLTGAAPQVIRAGKGSLAPFGLA
ncbi:MAG: threonylcarbamoyl-AMP synthase [Betaproteobacteria bacterium]|nr:threonylcarbamoyl-AMP synthase [Betaproteobacteria bacterium]